MVKSIWGEGDKLTLTVLKKTKMKGTWLGLAAGDGRYIPEILEKVDKLVVSDIDRKELQKLKTRLSKQGKLKVTIKILDMTKKFPFKEKSFDGVFCTGTIHLFSKETITRIFVEVDRILKPKGTFIFDFATDIIRTDANGKVTQSKNTNYYTAKGAKIFLTNLLKNYKLKTYKSSFTDDLIKEQKYGFVTKGKFLLFVAEKKER